VRRLEGPELVSYDLIGPDLLRRVRIMKVPILTPGTSGMTIGVVVMLRRDDDRTGNRKLIAHELVHVDQYSRQGVVGFLIRYARDYLRCLARHRRHREAYLAIPAEIEARAEAEKWVERRK